MNLSGKVAVVTGASSGIGAAIARELAAAGTDLVLTARRGDRLEAFGRESPTRTAVLPADIADSATAQRLLDLALERFGRADILVNNAGVLLVGPLETVDLDALSNMIRVNFEAVVRTSYTFARAFKAQKSGAIVNVSSIGAYVTAPMGGVYGGVKQAIEAFTSALRIELAGTGVRVGTVAPGTTNTEIFDAMRARGQKAWSELIPPLEAPDVADAVRFMLERPERANIARLLIYSSSEGF
jgi:NADP-dependent 3-hydroxy acid dehydrogenase YdfG